MWVGGPPQLVFATAAVPADSILAPVAGALQAALSTVVAVGGQVDALAAAASLRPPTFLPAGATVAVVGLDVGAGTAAANRPGRVRALGADRLVVAARAHAAAAVSALRQPTPHEQRPVLLLRFCCVDERLPQS